MCWFMSRKYVTSDVKRSKPKGWIRGNTKHVPVLEVKVAYHLYHYGVEIKIDSMQNDRSQLRTVISRGMNKYVIERPEENGESNHYEEVATSTGNPLATKQKEQFTPSLSSSSGRINCE